MNPKVPDERRLRVRCADWGTALILAQRAHAICGRSLREISVVRAHDGSWPLVVAFDADSSDMYDRLLRMAMGAK